VRRIFRARPGGRDAECEHTNRGVARFDEALRSAALPSLFEWVSERSTATRKVRILEIGCGQGRLLLELLARFGDDVELQGINHPEWPVAADARGLLATNDRHRILPRSRLRRLDLPKIHLADAQDLAAFPGEGGFDLVMSQVVVPHVVRKDRVLEESARLLAPGGVFLHEIDNYDGREPEFLAADLPRFAIESEGKWVSTTAYLELRGVGVRKSGARDRTVALATFRKACAPLDLGLVLDAERTVCLKSMPALDPVHRWGVRSVYRGRADADRVGGPPIASRRGSGDPPSPPTA
jgi:SAM-dependent methyltransferase